MAQPDAPDTALIERALKGDLPAFNALVDRYQGPVYNLCYRLLGSPQAAEDAAQEAFLSAYRSLPNFAGGNVRSWLLRIAANESKDTLRRQRRRPSTSLEQHAAATEVPFEPPDPAPSADTLLLQAELGASLQQALLTLPFEQRQAIVLVDLYDFRYEDVADLTGASVGTVKSRIHRGRERLRTYITAHPEQFGAPGRLEP